MPRQVAGASESDNLAIKGVVEMYAAKGDHIVTVLTEHKAVLDTARYLEAAKRATVTYLKVDRDGKINLLELSEAITERTVLVSVMLANNEIGTIQPVAEIGRICRERGVLFHSDATQGVGKVQIDVDAMNIDLMSFTGHKMHGPKGIGALYVRRKNPRVRLTPQIHGGGHERGVRSGTLNVAGIVGFGRAAEICEAEIPHEGPRITALRDKLLRGITDSISHVHLNGHPTDRLPSNLNLSFEGIDGGALLLELSEIALSGSSACSSAGLSASHVLTALGIGDALASSALRFGLSRYTTEDEVDYVVNRLIAVVEPLRKALAI